MRPRDHITQSLILISGLILFAFAATHFLNHALGLVRIEAMYEFQQWRWMITRSLPGSLLLAAALITHVALSLIKLANRTTLRLPPWELLQIGLGLAIPILLLPHIVDTRGASALFGVSDNYLYTLARVWPTSAVTQSILLILVWAHGCLGIHYWLRLNRRYRALLPVLILAVIALPLAGLAGFVVTGRAVSFSMQDADLSARVREVTHWPTPADDDQLAVYRLLVRIGFVVLIALVAGYMGLRHFLMLAAPKILIAYTGGPSIRAAIGPSLLEISRAHGVPLAAACGGRTRCTTCRVRIEQGTELLAPPNSTEAAVLASMGMPKDTRLACQLRPRASLTVTRMVPVTVAGKDATADHETESAGTEEPTAVLVIGMKDFASIAHGRLPYDVVFIVNEFIALVASTVTECRGRIDKIIGHDLVAVFGDHEGLEGACAHALSAVYAVDAALERLNQKISAEIGRLVESTIGIACGKTIIGRIGYGDAMQLTAIGTVVEDAMQLKAAAQRLGYQIVLSVETARHSGVSNLGPLKEVAMSDISNSDRMVEALAIERIRDLPASS